MSKYSLGVLMAAAIFVSMIVPAAGQRNGGAADLPDGPGKDAVAQECTKCHGVNNINKMTALTEKGEALPGRGDTPNKHDILTGTQPDGTAYPGSDSANTTCGNWVRYFPMSGKARVGHFDKNGNDSPTNSSWNSAHDTAGCSQDEIKSTGGDGLLYCFAVN